MEQASPAPRIRAVALAIIREGDEIFVFEGRDDVKSELFYRPLGGTIEFGETAVDAVKRELMEEIGVTVVDAQLVTVVENIFTFQGRPGHEVVFIFDVALEAPERLRAGHIDGYEPNGERINCMWRSIDEFRAGDLLYPEGLLAILVDRT
ncbi:MAG: NUDIX domain-containing protein [Chloroflexi bacterium]|nr:NUDIX domain-containing protein [Chloroflexota bacterium]